jgi:hypothetical protein
MPIDVFIAFSLAIFLSLSYDFLGSYLTLADRGLYIEGTRPELTSLSELNRTLLVSYIFTFFPRITEFLFASLSLYLQLILVQQLARSFCLAKQYRLLLLIVSFLPIRLLFRTIASKELVFSLCVQVMLLALIQYVNRLLKSASTSSLLLPVFRTGLAINIQSIGSLVLPVLFIASFSLRPFYACLIPIATYHVLAVARMKPFMRLILHGASLLVALTLFMFFIANADSLFADLQSLLNRYFFVDGASASTTRLTVSIPRSLMDLVVQFLSEPFQSILGPTLGEVISYPKTAIYWAEGSFLVCVFIYSLFRVSYRFFASSLTFETLIDQAFLLFSLLWLLFVYHIFSFINFAGGVRFQSASIPLLVFFLAFSFSGTRKPSTLMS